jgi:hypothetical protein
MRVEKSRITLQGINVFKKLVLAQIIIFFFRQIYEIDDLNEKEENTAHF